MLSPITLSTSGAADGVAVSASTWEHFPHDADIGVAGVGPTKAAAFEQAALALTAVVTDPEGVRPTEAVSIECRAATDELLLVEWLNTLVYEMAVRHMVFGAYSVSIDGGTLRATACGEHVDVRRHEPAVEIKGATLTALQVVRDRSGWRAQCVVDV
jgi:tRNA nucleotidyltransferase (CCA-adding enzyme)